jgi:hypothetical protein
MVHSKPSPFVKQFCMVNIVPDHDGGRREYINAWFLNTHMVYL